MRYYRYCTNSSVNVRFITTRTMIDENAISTAYKKDDNRYLATVKRVHGNDFSIDVNVLSSDLSYMLKIGDDGTHKLKARIAQHGNEDLDVFELRSDCCICSPTVIRLVLICLCPAKMAYHETGYGNRFSSVWTCKV